MSTLFMQYASGLLELHKSHNLQRHHHHHQHYHQYPLFTIPTPVSPTPIIPSQLADNITVCFALLPLPSSQQQRSSTVIHYPQQVSLPENRVLTNILCGDVRYKLKILHNMFYNMFMNTLHLKCKKCWICLLA